MTQIPPAAAELLTVVDRATTAFASATQGQAHRSPAPDKWSAAQILGHLIDSAANNHQRFVRVRWQDDLVFVGYEQDRWVEAQDYAHAPWADLLALWAAYNRHLVRVMTATPPAVLARIHRHHNLHELAWQGVREGEPVTLEWFFSDYVGHLRHHLRQIDALLGTRVG